MKGNSGKRWMGVKEQRVKQMVTGERTERLQKRKWWKKWEAEGDWRRVTVG